MDSKVITLPGITQWAIRVRTVNLTWNGIPGTPITQYTICDYPKGEDG